MSLAPFSLVLVCGSRSWHDGIAIRDRLAQLPPGCRVIHGGARGADSLAAIACRALGIPERAYPPDWRGKGRKAGIIRNVEMLDQRPGLVIAFWDGRSTGTAHTVGEAQRRGIALEVYLP